MRKYIGECTTHGLIQHEAQQSMIDIKGGAYCPYCGKQVDKVKWSPTKKKK
jgi:hypothetical protein